MMCANYWVHYHPMIVFICLHIADVSESNWTFKMQVHPLKCVSKSKSIFSIIFHAIYGAVFIQLTHFSCDNCENMCTLLSYHHQIGSMNHLPLFRFKSCKNGMCCMSFYILICMKARTHICTHTHIHNKKTYSDRTFLAAGKSQCIGTPGNIDDLVKHMHLIFLTCNLPNSFFRATGKTSQLDGPLVIRAFFDSGLESRSITSGLDSTFIVADLLKNESSFCCFPKLVLALESIVTDNSVFTLILRPEVSCFTLVDMFPSPVELLGSCFISCFILVKFDLLSDLIEVYTDGDALNSDEVAALVEG